MERFTFATVTTPGQVSTGRKGGWGETGPVLKHFKLIPDSTVSLLVAGHEPGMSLRRRSVQEVTRGGGGGWVGRVLKSSKLPPDGTVSLFMAGREPVDGTWWATL